MEWSVSVIIPTYNRKNKVLQAIDSVLQQSVRPDEILVVDDGSTDGTAEQIEMLFPDVILILQPTMGASSARNTGIGRARGEWIAFLDSDDRWMSMKLERQLLSLKKNPSYRICHTDEIWIRRGRRVNPRKQHRKSGGDLFARSLGMCLISPSSVMIHNEIFKKCGLFDTSLPVCEDYDMWLRICVEYPVLFIDEPLIVKTGGHADQLSRQYWGMDRFRIQAMERLLKTHHLDRDKRTKVLRMLLEKVDIYMTGARKRHKADELSVLQRKREGIVEELEQLTMHRSDGRLIY